MAEPLVSIVIPAYNAAGTISSCLESVCSQSWKTQEIIVVDDGSTDDTAAIVQKLQAKDPRIQLFRQANSGVSMARNLGLTKSTGTYVRFVDADDALKPGSLSAMVRRAEDTGCDLVIGGYDEVIGPVSNLRNLENRSDTVPCDVLLSRLNLWSNSFFYGVLWNKLFRRELIERQQVRFRPRLNWGEDFAFVCGYLPEVGTVSYMTESVYEYRRRVGGLTIRQAVNCIRHPFRNVHVKISLYACLKELYIKRGAYEQYRHTLWHYLFRFTLNQ